jgi:acyl-coenzyme A thioesterase PaaI-like protein
LTDKALDEAGMIAAGWSPLPTAGFSAAIGQTWVRGDPGGRTMALVAHDGVINDFGRLVHGGALMTFADMALGMGASDALDGGHLVTVQLQYQFAGGVKLGQLVTCAPELVRRTSSLVFVRGLIQADGETVGSAEGVFKALPAR